MKASSWPSRQTRLERIVREAARQSGRARVPAVHAPCALDVVLSRRAESEPAWCCVPGTQAPRTVRFDAAAARAWIAVGPEGGFDAMEIERFRRAGFGDLSLGGHVLRAETAAVVALGLLAQARPR